ncbi:MAG: glycosyltransferase [Ignavibacteriae bacterium]|nr:glycosyltransferase [Ignavibacteriota bacterium]
MNSYEILIVLLYLCIFELVYAFLLYPILLWLFSKFFKKPITENSNNKHAITVIISAYNEQSYIRDAIISVYESGYPKKLINILIGNDGSTDNTSKIIKELQISYPNIILKEYPRSGKNKILNNLIPLTTTDILVFMDSDIRIIPGTIDRFYCIKKNLYNPLPNNLVCDDYFPILNCIYQNKRVIFDPENIVIEVRENSYKNEIKRRIRLSAGSLATIWYFKRLLLPDYKWIAFFTLSHKLARYASPFMLILIFICSLLLSFNSNFYNIFVYGQLIIYFSSIIGWVFDKANISFLPFRVSLLFMTMNISFLIGIFWFIAGGQNAQWERDIK